MEARKGQSLDIQRAEQDDRLSGVNLRKADLNRDNVIQGRRENQRLYRQLSKLDGGRLLKGDLSSGAMQALKKASTPAMNDKVLFVGMRDANKTEAKNLSRRTQVQSVKGNYEGLVKSGGQKFDLYQPGEVNRFVDTLGLPKDSASKVSDVLNGAKPESRATLAGIAKAWAPGERGGQVPSRLALSGHSTGSSVWGDRGSMQISDLTKLAKAMPGAAAQVEDLAANACFTGGYNRMSQWREAFPNLRTQMAYRGSAPGTHSGALSHQNRWERATRGRTDELPANVARGTRKGQNIESWSLGGGYQAQSQKSLFELDRQRTEMEPTYQRFFRGDDEVKDTQRGPLRDYYRTIQDLETHQDTDESRRPGLQDQKDQTIRLIYYDKHVKKRFAQEHGAQIKAGYESLGLQAPDFSKLSRKEALEQIERFEDKLGSTIPGPAERLLPLLTNGLRDLRSSVVPNNWID